MVAEILTMQTVLERDKKVLIILPFVSVVREKMLYFQVNYLIFKTEVEFFIELFLNYNKSCINIGII